jgi:hypothetical protein
MPTTEPFRDRVTRLAREKHTSVSQLGQAAWQPGVKGTAKASLDAAMQGRRKPSRTLIEAIGRVLDVDPLEFPEYGLAALRAVPDERKVPLDDALTAARDSAIIVLASDALRADREDAPRQLRELAQRLQDQQRPPTEPEQDADEASGQ